MMKNIKTLFKMLKDPKKKSVALIIIYIIFFIFVSVIFKIIDNNSIRQNNNLIKELTSLEKFEQMKKYTFNVNIDLVENIIEGKYSDKKVLFNYNSNEYLLKDNLYIIYNDSYCLTDIEYNVEKFLNNNIVKLFKNMESISETKYSNGIIRMDYNILAKDFVKYYYDEDIYIEDKVLIQITEKEGNIIGIDIDISNLNYNIKLISINYNQDNFEDFDIDLNNYIYKEICE